MGTPQQQEIEALVASAIEAVADRSADGTTRVMRTLRRLVELDRPDDVDSAFVRHAARLLAPAWGRGWSPLDLVHASEHVLNPETATFVARCIAADATLDAVDRPEAWDIELAAVSRRAAMVTARPRGAQHCAGRFELCRFLLFIPPLAPVLVQPARWGTAATSAAPAFSGTVDQRTVERIRALLAKAEGTTYEAEALAFSGKAQELMARYAIDVAMLMDRAPGDSLRSGVRARRVHIDAPYAPEKAQLLGVVASVNGARAVWHRDFKFATVAGFPVELELVVLAFTSLLVQMSQSMVRVSGIEGGRGRSPAFRRAFVVSYAGRIAERLEESRRHAEQDAARDYGSAVVPVRTAQQQAVKEQMDEWFPGTEPFGRRSYDAAGWHAGRRAADSARLEHGRGQLAC